VIKQAADKGIVVVSVDQAVTAPEAYVLTNDQVEYAKLGAKWLFDKLGGKGSVVEMRGIDGVPGDTDRHQGFTEVLKDYPGIKVTSSVFMGWSQNKSAEQMKELLASGKQIDGVWTSGIDKTVVDAYQTAGKPFVPVVGADNNGFIGQMIDMKEKGVTGVAVSNPPAVGAAGLGLALDVLAKKDVPHAVKITPTVWDNDKNLAELKKAYNPKLDPYYSDEINIPPYTSFTMDQLIDCKGP
jgi:ribose transport system substrate-binding protein